MFQQTSVTRVAGGLVEAAGYSPLSADLLEIDKHGGVLLM